MGWEWWSWRNGYSRFLPGEGGKKWPLAVRSHLRYATLHCRLATLVVPIGRVRDVAIACPFWQHSGQRGRYRSSIALVSLPAHHPRCSPWCSYASHRATRTTSLGVPWYVLRCTRDKTIQSPVSNLRRPLRSPKIASFSPKLRKSTLPVSINSPGMLSPCREEGG